MRHFYLFRDHVASSRGQTLIPITVVWLPDFGQEISLLHFIFLNLSSHALAISEDNWRCCSYLYLINELYVKYIISWERSVSRNSGQAHAILYDVAIQWRSYLSMSNITDNKTSIHGENVGAHKVPHVQNPGKAAPHVPFHRTQAFCK